MVTRDQILYSSKSQDALSLKMLLEGISLERDSFSEYVWKVLGEVFFPLLDCGAFKVQLEKQITTVMLQEEFDMGNQSHRC